MTEPTARDVLAEAQERIATLTEERDRAREDAGHEKAMRRFCGEERDRFIRETMRLKDELAAALSLQPEAAGEAGLRAALDDAIATLRHIAADAEFRVAALAAPALPEPER